MADGSMGERRIRVRVEGRVQGVGFRYWVAQTAGGMGLRGWVRNRRDASVEAVFSGRADLVQDMFVHCQTGPVSARVASVVILEDGYTLASDVFEGFEMRPTV